MMCKDPDITLSKRPRGTRGIWCEGGLAPRFLLASEDGFEGGVRLPLEVASESSITTLYMY